MTTEAKLWIIKHQMGRRNLTPYQKAKLVLQMKGLVEEIKNVAKQSQLKGIKNLKNVSLPDSDVSVWSESDQTDELQESNDTDEQVHTYRKLAEIAGVSYDTLIKTKKVLEKAPKDIEKKVYEDTISLNQAYKEVKKIEKHEELEKRKKQGLHEFKNTENFKVINDDFRNVKLWNRR